MKPGYPTAPLMRCAWLGATLAAEAGATDRQLMAMFDWANSEPSDRLHARGRPQASGRVGHFENKEMSRRTNRVDFSNLEPPAGVEVLDIAQRNKVLRIFRRR
jgi:hypothetical protein